MGGLAGCGLGGQKPADRLAFDPDRGIVPSAVKQGGHIDLMLRRRPRQLARRHYQIPDTQIAGGLKGKLTVFVGEDGVPSGHGDRTTVGRPDLVHLATVMVPD
jgi:hypothetical protein